MPQVTKQPTLTDITLIFALAAALLLAALLQGFLMLPKLCYSFTLNLLTFIPVALGLWGLHELAHLAAMKLLKVEVTRLKLTLTAFLAGYRSTSVAKCAAVSLAPS